MTQKIWDKNTVRELREKYNLSQQLFALIVGTRQQTISEWELGIYKPMNAYARVLTAVEAELERLWVSAKKNEDYFQGILTEVFVKDIVGPKGTRYTAQKINKGSGIKLVAIIEKPEPNAGE